MSFTKIHSYQKDGRLGDILALIQVLALGGKSHRNKNWLASELQRNPQPTECWQTIFSQHPEFSRVKPESENLVSIIARHVATEEMPLSADQTSKLLQIGCGVA